MATETSKPSVLSKSENSVLLVKYLKNHAEVKKILPRRHLYLQVGKERFCYLILKGRATYYRRSDDLAMSTVSAPSMVGIANLQKLQQDGYLKTLVTCDIAILKMSTVHEVITTNQLWELVAKHMMDIAGKLFVHSKQLTAPSAYDIIRIQLNELFHELPAIRNNITAEKYIRDKTHLSRSGVMRILASLREGGYIEMHRGKLINIVKLPVKY